jgi:hypothetical protein
MISVLERAKTVRALYRAAWCKLEHLLGMCQPAPSYGRSWNKNRDIIEYTVLQYHLVADTVTEELNAI